MLTNILATILITVTTNTYHPQQHRSTSIYLTYPATAVERWDDGPGFGNSETRDNPDVRITEVKKSRHLIIPFEGKRYRILLGETVLSRKEEHRTIAETWHKAEGE